MDIKPFEHQECNDGPDGEYYVPDKSRQGAVMRANYLDTTLCTPHFFAPDADGERPKKGTLRLRQPYHEQYLFKGMDKLTYNLSNERMALHEVIMYALLHDNFLAPSGVAEEWKGEQKFRALVEEVSEKYVMPRLREEGGKINREAENIRAGAYGRAKLLLNEQPPSARFTADEYKGTHPTDPAYSRDSIDTEYDDNDDKIVRRRIASNDDAIARRRKASNDARHTLRGPSMPPKDTGVEHYAYERLVPVDPVQYKAKYGDIFDLAKEKLEVWRGQLNTEREMTLKQLNFLSIEAGVKTERTARANAKYEQASAEAKEHAPHVVADAVAARFRREKMRELVRNIWEKECAAQIDDYHKQNHIGLLEKKADGTRQVRLVAGGPGTGKSALVRLVATQDLGNNAINQNPDWFRPLLYHDLDQLDSPENNEVPKVAESKAKAKVKPKAKLDDPEILEINPRRGSLVKEETSLIFDQMLARWREMKAAPNLLLDVATLHEWTINTVQDQAALKLYEATVDVETACRRANKRAESEPLEDRRYMSTPELLDKHKCERDLTLRAVRRNPRNNHPLTMYDLKVPKGTLAKAADYDAKAHSFSIYRPVALMAHWRKADINVFAKKTEDFFRETPSSTGRGVLEFAKEVDLNFFDREGGKLLCSIANKDKTYATAADHATVGPHDARAHSAPPTYKITLNDPQGLQLAMGQEAYDKFAYAMNRLKNTYPGNQNEQEYEQAIQHAFGAEAVKPFKKLIIGVRGNCEGPLEDKDTDAFKAAFGKQLFGQLFNSLSSTRAARDGRVHLAVAGLPDNTWPTGIVPPNDASKKLEPHYDALSEGKVNDEKNLHVYAKLLNNLLKSHSFYARKPVFVYKVTDDVMDSRKAFLLKELCVSNGLAYEDEQQHRENPVFVVFDSTVYPTPEACNVKLQRMLNNNTEELGDHVCLMHRDRLNMFYRQYDEERASDSPIKKFRTWARFMFYAYNPKEKDESRFTEVFTRRMAYGETLAPGDEKVFLITQPQMQWLQDHSWTITRLVRRLEDKRLDADANVPLKYKLSNLEKQFRKEFFHRDGEPMIRVRMVDPAELDAGNPGAHWRPIPMSEEHHHEVLKYILATGSELCRKKGDSEKNRLIGIPMDQVASSVIHLPRRREGNDSRVQIVEDGWLVIDKDRAEEILGLIEAGRTDEIYGERKGKNNKYPIRAMTTQEVEAQYNVLPRTRTRNGSAVHPALAPRAVNPGDTPPPTNVSP